jgi:hypothetical protein
MEIREAFGEEAIRIAGADVGGHEENELREVIRELAESNRMEFTREDENLAVGCFIAGRTYQSDIEPMFPIPLVLLPEFMAWMVERVTHE